MKRTKLVEGKKSIKWINNGGNFYMADGQVIKHGESFMAAADEVPKAFRSTIQPADPEELKIVKSGEENSAEAVQIDAVKPSYEVKQRKNTAYFDIFDARGKKLNDKNLTEEEAQDLRDKLMSE